MTAVRRKQLRQLGDVRRKSIATRCDVLFLSKISHANFDTIPSVLLQRSPNLKGPPSGGLLFSDQDLSNRSGNLAIFSAIRRASSLLSSLAAALCS